MKRYTFRNKHYKVIIEKFTDSILIQIYDKYGLEMSAISENYEELNDDINFVLSYMKKSKEARRWLMNTIKITDTIYY